MNNFLTSKGHVKRPMNAFLVFAQEQRPIMSKIFPQMTNCQISSVLGKFVDLSFNMIGMYVH